MDETITGFAIATMLRLKNPDAANELSKVV